MMTPGQDELDKRGLRLTIANGYQTHISKIIEWVQINNGKNKSQQMVIFPEPWTDSNHEARDVVILFNINANLCEQRGRLGVAQGHRYPLAYKDSFSILNFILIGWGEIDIPYKKE